MRLIQKNPEPRALTAHRSVATHVTFDNFAGKNELRVALAEEQRYLCCYCMSRIRPSPEHMKIEHWRGQRTHPELQLEYANLLGACLGNQGRPPVDHLASNIVIPARATL